MEKNNKNMLHLIISIVFLLSFTLNWISYNFDFWGYISKQSITIMHSNMSELSFFLGVAKIFAIISSIFLVINIINYFIDLNSLMGIFEIKNLKKYLIYISFGSYSLTILFAFLGIILTKYAHMSIWFIISIIIYLISASLILINIKQLGKEVK